MRRIYLSPPAMCGRELDLVRDAFATNWIAPYGPHVDAFEREFAETICRLGPQMYTSEHGGVNPEALNTTSHLLPLPLHAAALSSGTAALHLALRILMEDQAHGIGSQRLRMNPARRAEIICSTFTFAASANPIAYEGAEPVFIDSDAESWNMDPGLLREELADCMERGRLPRAVIVVDLYGQCADYDPIVMVCAEFGVPLIEDAAEALGAVYWGRETAKAKTTEADPRSASTSVSAFPRARSAGSFGSAAAFSFNGNKIVTSAGGGMLVSHDQAITDRARFLATQARDVAPHYQHSEIGFNYRMSNVLAAIGRGQLTVLSDRVQARRRTFECYRQMLSDLPGVGFMPEAPFGRSTRWLTCLTIDPKEFGATSEDVWMALQKEGIESRPLWKPMHLQPAFKGCRVRGGSVSERLFRRGLCLPSGSALTDEDLERICGLVRGVHEKTVRHYIPPASQHLAARLNRTEVANSPSASRAQAPAWMPDRPNGGGG